MNDYVVIKTYGEDQKAFGPFTALSTAKEFIHTDVKKAIEYFSNGFGESATNFIEHPFSNGSTLLFDLDTIGTERIDWVILMMNCSN